MTRACHFSGAPCRPLALARKPTFSSQPSSRCKSGRFNAQECLAHVRKRHGVRLERLKHPALLRTRRPSRVKTHTHTTHTHTHTSCAASLTSGLATFRLVLLCFFGGGGSNGSCCKVMGSRVGGIYVSLKISRNRKKTLALRAAFDSFYHILV